MFVLSSVAMQARTRRRGPRVALAIVSLLATHLIYSFAALGSSLWSTQREAKELKKAMRSDDLSGLLQQIRSMVVAGESAVAAADGAGMALLSILPGTDADLDVLRFTAHAAGKVSRFGLDSGAEISRIAGDRGLATAFYRDGRINFDTVAEVEGLASRTSDFVDIVTRDATRLPQPRSALAARLHRRLLRTLMRAQTGLTRARLLLSTLPQLTGRDTPQSYLLAFQSPSEARGSGGIIGVYGILEAEAGELELRHVGPVRELGIRIKDPVDAPTWFKDLYGDLLALEEMRHVNLSMNFPAVARVLLGYYEQARGESLDGVITLDPIVLEQLTTGMPPLRGPGWDVKVDSSNAKRVLMHDSYLKFGRFHAKDQNRFLQGLVQDLMNNLSRGRANAPAVLLGLAKAAKWQHLKLFSADPALQEALSSLQVDGDYAREGPNVQVVFHNNFTGSKVDYFLRRDLHTEVTLEPDGDAAVTTTIRLDNRAPTEPSSLLIRPLLRKFPNGHNRMTLSFLLPRGSESLRMEIDGTRAAPLRGNEAGYPVAWDIVDVPAGEIVDASITYRVPNAVTNDSYSVTLWPQALVRPDDFTFELRSSGGDILDVFPRRRLHNGAYILSGRLFGPKQITAKIAR